MAAPQVKTCLSSVRSLDAEMVSLSALRLNLFPLLCRLPQEQEVTCVQCVTEGEEADAEDSDMDAKRLLEEQCVEKNKGRETEGHLIHQFTKTSVESQSGSMEAVYPEPKSPVSPLRPIIPKGDQETTLEGPKMVSVSTCEGAGGKGHRRSRSPARSKRRTPKECDLELDDMEL